MASAMIHICVANKVNEVLRMDPKMIALGSIAPDLSKQVGERKIASHFLDNDNEDAIPNIERFLKKYRSELVNPFEMGYLIHLLTDKYWFRDYVYEYIKNYQEKHHINGELSYTALKNLIYQDYTNLNHDLIDEYNVDLYLFANEIVYPKTKIAEIDSSKLPVIVEKMGLIIKDSQESSHPFLFDLTDIKIFIEECSKQIIEDLSNYNII